MSDAVFPPGLPLTPTLMAARLERWAKTLRAVEVWREPRADARWRVLAKANIGTAEFPTTAGSFALRALRLPDAFCVTRLKAAGIDVFGKATMTELANFVTTARPNSGYSQLGGFPVNPWGDFLPGGSSAGSAVAVAAGLCDAALGTETKGSLMVPGLANGVWAYKPTRGLISRSGIVPISRHFDTPGVLARDLTTAVSVAAAMRGEDPEDDATLVSDAIDLEEKTLDRPVRLGLIAVAGQPIPPERRALLEARCPADVTLVELTVPAVDFDYKTITSQDIRRDMDALLGRHAEAGTPAGFAELVAFYRAHPETHPFGMDRLDDAEAMPVMTPVALHALALGSINAADALIRKVMREAEVDALIALDFVDWWAISGAPSLTVPMGTDDEGRPFGVMLGGRWAEDGALIDVARRFATTCSAPAV